MLRIFILSIVVFTVAMIAMAVGVIISNRRIQGSCGGLSNLKDTYGKPYCSLCSIPASECPDLLANKDNDSPGDSFDAAVEPVSPNAK